MTTLKPGLYLVATPIGNLGDMTFRAVETLQNVDAILCEDTRTSRTLLQHYAIRKPLLAYHDHNEQQQAPALLERIRQGERLALISDAGTPLVADPGYRLVRLCHEHNIPVTVLPGACAPVAALAASGLIPVPFCFLGFLPPKESACREFLQEQRQNPATLIFFETARRLDDTLRYCLDIFGNRTAVVARELTKRFEEVRHAPVADLLSWYQEHPPKGEIVLLMEGHTANATQDADWQSLLQQALNHQSLKDAVQAVASATGVPRKTVYQAALSITASKT